METKKAAGREGAQPDSGVYLASVRPLQRPFSSHRFAAAMFGPCGAWEGGGEGRKKKDGEEKTTKKHKKPITDTKKKTNFISFFVFSFFFFSSTPQKHNGRVTPAVLLAILCLF